MRRSRALLLLCVSGLLVLAPVTTGQTADYDVSIDGSIDIADRTISTDWGEHTISAVGKHDEGDRLRASTSGPANESYAIRIIDSEQRLRDSEYATGDGRASFSLDRYDPGTYAVAVMNGTDEVYAVEPFVVRGYAVEQSVPAEAKAGSSFSVDATLTAVSDDVTTPPATVQVVVGNGTESVRVNATREAGLNYTATVDAGSLSPGTYEVYTTVRRDNEVFGEQELLGLSETASVTIAAESTTTDGSGDGNEDEDTNTEAPESDGSGSSAAASDPTPEPTERQTHVTETSERTAATAEPGTTASETEPVTDTGSTTTHLTTTADGSTPPVTTSASAETETESPVFADGALLALVAVLAGAVFRFRR